MLMSKHVLGLDLGVGSIGWCLIALDEQGDPAEILGMGSRVVPLTNLGDDKAFSKGIMQKTKCGDFRKRIVARWENETLPKKHHEL